MHTRGNYHSFLLRLWRANKDSGWRISLTRVGDEERLNFSHLEDVVEFLEAQTCAETEEGDGDLPPRPNSQ